MDNQKIKEILNAVIGTKNVMRITEHRCCKKDDMLRDDLLRNQAFHDKYKGKRCFIFGNGPSINALDFSRFENEYVFTVNQLSRHKNFHQLKSDFHVWADPRFYDIKADRSEDMELLEVMKGVNTPGNKPLVFYDFHAKHMIEQFDLSRTLDIAIYAYCGTDTQKALKNYVDFTHFVPHFHTVVQYTICLAVYMGFEEIYLLGCDCSGFISSAQAILNQAEKSEYGYRISENEKKRMERTKNDRKFRDELQSYVDLFDTYEMLSQYCLANGSHLFNATQGGLLECVDRAELDAVL